MKYSDCPNTEVSIEIAAKSEVVWKLVSDIELSSRFSTEVSGAEWIEGSDHPALGAKFVGHSAHDAIGEWTTTCVVTGFQSGSIFEWSVLGTDNDVSSIWRYKVERLSAEGTQLTYWFQMGPGRGGLNFAIDAMPDKEERIVERRIAEHRSNMERVVAGVRELAESEGSNT